MTSRRSHRATLLLLGVACLLALPVGTQPAVEVVAGDPRGHHAAGDGVEVDLAYGTEPHQLFDWWKPANASPPTPVVVYVHGGYAPFNHKGDVATYSGSLLTRLLDHGITVMAVNYVPYHELTFPAQVEDIGLAVQYFRQHADSFRIDPKHLVLWGLSSGAIQAGVLAYGPDLADPLGTPLEQRSTRPQGFLNDAGAVDLTLMVPETIGVMLGYETLGEAPPELVAQASPAQLVCSVPRAWTPPVISRYGPHATEPPLVNWHDATFMHVLHSALRQCATEAALDSFKLLRFGESNPVNEAFIVTWVLQFTGSEDLPPFGWPEQHDTHLNGPTPPAGSGPTG